MTAREIISNLVLAISERQKGNVARDEGAYIDEARTFWLADGGKGEAVAARKLDAARGWIEDREHGDNCFVSSQYAGDPGSRCNCGKDAILGYLESDTAPQAECAPRDSNESAYQRGYLDGMAKGKRDAQIDAAECAPREAPECTDGGKCGAGGYCGECTIVQCAPREAQPVAKIDADGDFVWLVHNPKFAEGTEFYAAPTPERADADTATQPGKEPK
jgi:hypothetical protein